MPPKSIFKQPGARKFQLVHRSQRDPLIHDPDASQHVLKEVSKNSSKNVDGAAPAEEREDDGLGGAALYGVYYDDSDYDYMQHLRAIGVKEDGVDTMLVESKPPKSTNVKAALIPKEALPSAVEIPASYETSQAIPESLAGLQPDMDPNLRQTLEALEDEAFVQEDADDDFFGELLADGERNPDEQVDFEEEGRRDDELDHENQEQDGWEARFASFKRSQASRPKGDLESEGESEALDEVGSLPGIGKSSRNKNKRAAGSASSARSMSSSAMFRNEGLTRLDEQYEKFERDYELDDEEPSEESDNSDSDSAPQLLQMREDFEAALDDFLEHELVGNKLKRAVPGDTGNEKLSVIRDAFQNDETWRKRLLEREYDDGGNIPMPAEVERERWDCETVLTTYSNLENHPRLLRLRAPKTTRAIRLDPKTGLPETRPESQELKAAPLERKSEGPLKRPRGEGAAEKKARKELVKAERQMRRREKNERREQFAVEQRRQQHQQQEVGVRKL